MTTAVLVLALIAGAGACGEGWYRSGARCFHVSQDADYWRHGRRYCQALHATLAFVDPQQDHDFLKGLLTGLGVEAVWLGLTDMQEEGQFRWLDGSQAHFYNFAEGEPSGDGDHADEDCVEMAADRDYRWNDESCMKKNRHLCSKPAE